MAKWSPKKYPVPLSAQERIDMVVLQTMLEFCGQPPARDAGISQEDLKQSYDRLRAKDYARPDRMTEGTRLPLWVITNDGDSYLRTLVDRMMRAKQK